MIDIHQHGPFAHLRLARPPVNALNPELCLALVAAVDEAAAAGSHGILLSGGARVFSAGLDVPYLMSLGVIALPCARHGRHFLPPRVPLPTARFP